MDLRLEVKVGSIIRHMQEMQINPTKEDVVTVEALLQDPDVLEWMQDLDDRALLPVMR